MNSQSLLHEIRAFVTATKTPSSNAVILERSKSAIVLLRSLPCARAAVLEQICEIFQEAVHRHIVESDSNELLGTFSVPDADPDVYDVIQSIYDILLEFVNNNPEAWAPIITKWSVYLLGQLSTKYSGQRGNKPSLSLNEKLQMWMGCPATQMLMEISAQCFSKLIDSNPELCVNCLLESAVKYTPHFDWVVAYIGSYFFKAIIDHLLRCAVREFHKPANGENDNEFSSLLVTALRILDYFATQYPDELKESVLTMFKESLVDGKQTCLVPFFIHLGTHAPSILNVVTIPFLDTLEIGVMVKLYSQLSQSNHSSLLPTVVGLVVSLKKGSYRVFQFLVALSLNTQDAAPTTPEALRILDETQRHSIILLEQVFVQLQRLVTKKYQGVTTADGTTKESGLEIPFLDEIKDEYKNITAELLKSRNECSRSWYFRLLSCVSVYSGATTAVEILNHILSFRGTSQSLSLYIQLHKEVQAFFPTILDQALAKYLKNMEIKSSPDIVEEVQISLENLQKLVRLENDDGKNLSGFSVTRSLKQHSTLLVSFMPYPSKAVSSATLDLLLTFGFQLHNMTVSNKIRIVRICCTFFFKLLHDYNDAHRENNYELCQEYLEMLNKHKFLLTMLSKDGPCKLYLVRNIMEGVVRQENRWLFSRKGKVNENRSNAKDEKSLFEKNLKPGISSRLPLNTASVFYIGVIGKGLEQTTENENLQDCYLLNSQYFLQVISDVCQSSPTSFGYDSTSNNPSIPYTIKALNTLAMLLKDLLVSDGSFECNTWPEEEIIKYSIERDIKIHKEFDDSEMFWHLLLMIAEVPNILLHCLAVIHGLFSAVVKFWEQNREPKTTDCPSHLNASVQIMTLLRKAMWLPPPLCLIGEIFHIISPKEVHKLLMTTWEFLKENPPSTSTRMTTEIKEGHHKDVVKSIFLGNIAELGHVYARFFPVSRT